MWNRNPKSRGIPSATFSTQNPSPKNTMANQLAITGIFRGAQEVQSFANNFTVRVFTLDITNGGQYQKTLDIRLIKDKTSLIDGFNEGDELTVHINLETRHFTTKAGNAMSSTEVTAWKIEGTPAAQPAPAQRPQTVRPSTPPAAPVGLGNDDGSGDSLPF